MQPNYLTPFDGMPKYAQSMKDWEYLEGQRNLIDQVEEVDFFEGSLMRHPNKMTATVLLHQRIERWFKEWDGEVFDRRTRGIMNRHLIDMPEEPCGLRRDFGI